MRDSTASVILPRQLHRPGQRRDVRNVLGAGPAPSFLMPSDHERADGCPAPHEEGAHALGAWSL